MGVFFEGLLYGVCLGATGMLAVWLFCAVRAPDPWSEQCAHCELFDARVRECEDMATGLSMPRASDVDGREIEDECK
jgi:hypothetical protein